MKLSTQRPFVTNGDYCAKLAAKWPRQGAGGNWEVRSCASDSQQTVATKVGAVQPAAQRNSDDVRHRNSTTEAQI